MHDIVCPHCGDRFLSSDVAFDLSKYIQPLLYENINDSEAVQNVEFKFYADEDSIVKNTTPNHHAILFCDNKLGPDRSEEWFPYVVTGELLFNYIEERANWGSDLAEILQEIAEVRNDRKLNYTAQHVSVIKTLYQLFFGAARKSVTFDIEDDNVQTAIKILLHIVSHPQLQTTINVRLYSSQLNKQRPDYVIPDLMFVFDSGTVEKLSKCCRYCGAILPMEYGYYRMYPIVLLGSHFAGKTSFLSALLYTVENKSPFIDEKKIKWSTLENDVDLRVFNTNVERYREGKPPIKTDLHNVPILNIKIGYNIYAFIDWPGEKFITNFTNIDDDYVFQSRRVIRRATHFLCFVEPSQIDRTLPLPEENVNFSSTELLERFKWHMDIADIHKIKSVTYIVNKADLLRDTPNAMDLALVMDNAQETDIFSAGVWHQDEFDKIDGKLRRYIDNQDHMLYSGFDTMDGFEKVHKAYLPVAPYGKRTDLDDADNSNVVIHQTALAGLPLLHILKVDGVL